VNSRPGSSARREVPAHQRLSDELRQRLRDGEFANGRQLPTEAELEQERGLSRQTVRRAFVDLVAEGLVRRIPGRGTFAVHSGTPRYARTVGSIDDLMEWGDSELEVADQIALRNDAELASRLELESPAVAVLSYRRTFAGAVFGTTQVAMSPALGQQLIEADAFHADARTVIRAVDACLGGVVAGVQQTLNAVAASAEVAAVLELEEGAPVLYAERLFFDADERPVELATTHYHPDRYAYRLEIRGRVGATIVGR
jgi:DNA-binding GntR family transcriptional regulator